MADHIQLYVMMKRLEDGPVADWIATACIDLINEGQARLTHDDPALCEFAPKGREDLRLLEEDIAAFKVWKASRDGMASDIGRQIEACNVEPR